jgi:DNA adenine methylase
MVLLNYIGGKLRAAETICSVMPNNIKQFVSPFFGAGSVEFLFAVKYPEVPVHGFDAFPELVMFWNTLKYKKKLLIDGVRDIIPVTKKIYKNTRKKLLEKQSRVEKALNFLIVNKCSFNGIMSASYSRNLARQFNNTPKRLANFKFPKNLSVKQNTFEVVIHKYPNSFLFLDPPYYNVKHTYGIQGEFSTIDHNVLFKLLKNRTSPWLLVYNDTPWVRNKYKSFHMFTFNSRYSSNKVGQQLLICNYNPSCTQTTKRRKIANQTSIKRFNYQKIKLNLTQL